MTLQVLRLFVSSPGDVADERRRIDLVVERLNTEFAARIRIETIRWETSYYSAHDTFQKQIPEAADCDLVVAIFRARLGTPLPAEFPVLPSGQPYPSGTAYEVLTAIEARKAGKPIPDVYVFRYPKAPSVPLDAPDRAEIEAQWGRLKSFFDDWFRTKSGEFIAAFQGYESTDDFATQVEDCLRQWLARRGFLPQGSVWDRMLRGSPFPGLSAFEADRGSVFFGRDLAIAQGIARLREAGAGGSRLPFLLVIGASGSGKSSLLRAALLPRLTLPGTIPDVDLWSAAVVTPGPDPFLSLAEGLFADAAMGPALRQGAFRTAELLAKQLAGDIETAVAPLRDALDRAADAHKTKAHFADMPSARLALVIDQAERLFIESEAETATAFAELVAALVRHNLAYVILALRSDAYARFQSIEALVELREAGATLDLVPPTAAELEEIVTRPVIACHPPLAFEQNDGRSLAALLVADAKGGDALPLLQMTLSRLYAAEGRRGDGRLRFADYRGMDVAVTETANEALNTLDDAARAELPSLVFGLIDDVSADPLTGALVPVVTALDRKTFEAQNPARQVLVEAFVNNRLLTAEGDGVSQRVRPVHEALLRIWPQAVAIVRESAALIRVRYTLEPLVREWLAASPDDKPRHLEISPALLDGAQQLLARVGNDLPADMRGFITQAAAADAAWRDRERNVQERRIRDAQDLAAANRRIARSIAVGLVAALVLVVLAGWQWWEAGKQTRIAQTQTQIAQTQTKKAEQAAQDADTQRKQAEQARSRVLAALADQRINAGDVTTGTLLALEAAEQNPTDDVAAALINGRLHLREATVLSAPGSEARASVFSPTGHLFTTATTDELEIWETATGRRVAVASGHRGTINDATFSRDGAFIATASDDATARIWSSRSGKLLAVLEGHGGQVSTIAFNSSSTRLVTASRDRTARIWDIFSGKIVAVLSGHGDVVTHAVFSPDGRMVLTTSNDRTARIWNAETGTQMVLFKEHNAEVRSGSFSADGRAVLTRAAGGRVAVWESATGKVVSLFGHSHDVLSAEFIPRTTEVVTASYDQTARIFDGKSGRTLAVLVGHQGLVMKAQPSADGRYIVTASTDGTARIWDVVTRKAIATLSGHTDWVMNAAFSPAGNRIMTVGRDRTVRLWADESVTITTGRTAPRFRLWRADISPDGSLVAAPAKDNEARIWDVRTRGMAAVLKGHTATINAISFDGSGQRIVTASNDRTARIWDVKTGRSLVVLKGHSGPVSRGAFSPDGKRIATASGGDNTVRIWDADTGRQLVVLTGHTGGIAKATFSPDGKRILTVSPFDRTVRLWDSESGKPSGRGILLRGSYWSAAFSPDGKRIVATAIDVTILDADTGDFIASYPSFGERVADATYSPDGKLLLLASLDNTARVWNAEDGRPVSILGGHADGVFSVAISSDGKRLMTASGPQTLRIWPMGTNARDLIVDLKSAVPRCLTMAERAEFNLPPTTPDWCFDMEKWPYQSRAWKIWRRHQQDKEASPLPDSSGWLPWVRKLGADLRVQKPAEALIYLDEAISVLKRYSQNVPDEPRWRSGLASTLIDRGHALNALHRRDEAIAAFESALPLVMKLAADEADNKARAADVAVVLENLADALVAAQRRAEGIKHFRQARLIRSKLAAEEPDNLGRQGGLAFVLSRLASELLAERNLGEALDNARDNIAIRRKLVAAERGNADRRENLAFGLRMLADILLADGRRAEAIAAFRESLAIRQEIAVAEPNNVDRQNNLAYAYGRLAGELLTDNATGEAVAAYRLALATQQKLAAAAQDDDARARALGSAHWDLAMALHAQGAQSDALKNFREALVIRERDAGRAEREEITAQGKPGRATAGSLGNLAWRALFARDFEKALTASRRAADLAPDLIWIQTNLAHALMFLNRTEEARAIHLQFRGRPTLDGKTWQQTVLEDFAIFRRAGLNHPMMETIEKLLAAQK